MARVAVVTGGASTKDNAISIGHAIARRLGRNEYKVAVFDIDAEAAERTAEELRNNGAEASAYGVDVGDRRQVDAAMDKVRSDLGPVEILITSAAIAPRQPFEDITPESFMRVLQINLIGTFNCIQSALPDMLKSRWGRIVMISSSSAQRGGAGMVPYSASKGGVIAMTKSVALTYASTGVTVNNVSPSAIDTPSVRKKEDAGMLTVEGMARNIPVGRIGTGDDIAAACMYLISEDASYTTGQTVSVNGGAYVGA
jgi:2-hydroxycyclohexanecarboxyl-CoA dehydrogenase